MIFRSVLQVVTACLWGFTFWMATHTSASADVLSRYSTAYFILLLALFVISGVVTLLNFGSLYRRFQRHGQNLMLLVLSSLAALVLAELLIRLVDPIGVSYYAEAKKYHLEKLADEELYYRHRPNLVREYQDVRVETNELGFRDEPIAERPRNGLRVLFLGDSVTFGWGVSQADTFAHRVSGSLSDRLQRPVQTFNTGVGSYNTHNQHALLDRYGEALDPDFVALLYVTNDTDATPTTAFNPWGNYSFSGKSPPEVLRLIAGRSWTIRLLAHFVRYGAGGSVRNLDTTGRGWQQSADALERIAEYCRARSIPLAVFLYRMEARPFDDDIARELGSLSASAEFHFIDVLPWFDGRDIRPLTNSVVDSHPNADGHAILADGMTDVLAALLQHEE